MNAYEFDTTVGRELEGWHARLAEVTGKIDRLPSIEKYRLTPYIEGLHILLAELDERIGELRHDRFNVLPTGMVVHPVVVEREACNFKECEGVRYDYDFGG